MLLIEKVTNRVVRQTSEEVQNSLALPLSILHHSPLALQIGVCSSKFIIILTYITGHSVESHRNIT